MPTTVKDRKLFTGDGFPFLEGNTVKDSWDTYIDHAFELAGTIDAGRRAENVDVDAVNNEASVLLDHYDEMIQTFETEGFAIPKTTQAAHFSLIEAILVHTTPDSLSLMNVTHVDDTPGF